MLVERLRTPLCPAAQNIADAELKRVARSAVPVTSSTIFSQREVTHFPIYDPMFSRERLSRLIPGENRDDIGTFGNNRHRKVAMLFHALTDGLFNGVD